MEKMMHELLAPAGSYPVFRAVIAAGADAVYLGGDKYSARAFAPNFTLEEIIKAIDTAHLYGRKTYLAVNTLLKNRETGEELCRYLAPFYERGLDAVIVQDFGVFSIIKKIFPDLPIHVSTQTSVASAYGAGFWAEQGASRIVPARELSLADIRNIHEKTGMELECFIHGALCYCYSGQCLMSSFIGGRSGNRGRCAGACRLPYAVEDESGHPMRSGESYPLSLKDLCTIEELPNLCDAGIYSFKIEGRMKSQEYAAGVTAIYRKYLDLYENDPENYHVKKEDMDALTALGNRSGFTKGYYGEWSGRDMVTFTDSSHTSAKDADAKNWELPPIPIVGKVRVEAEKPMELALSDGDGHDVAATAAAAQAAKKHPLTPDELKNRISKTGDTHFAFEKLDIELGKNCFVPVARINELRRRAISRLEENILSTYRRKAPTVYENNFDGGVRRKQAEPTDRKSEYVADSFPAGAKREKKKDIENVLPCLDVIVSNEAQLAAVISSPVVDMVSLDLGASDAKYFRNGKYDGKLFRSDIEKARDLIAKSGKKSGFSFPFVFGSKPQSVFEGPGWDGVYSQFDVLWVRSYDSLGYCLAHLPERTGCIRLDFGVPVFSAATEKAFESLGISGYAASPELNRGELSHMPNAAAEFCLYGYQPVMVAANCLYKNFDACQRGKDPASRKLFLKDGTGQRFYVGRCCRDGLNVIYNGKITYLLHRRDKIQGLGFGSYRMVFTEESPDEIKSLLDAYRLAFIMEETVPAPESCDFTGGHFGRGVE